MATRPSPAPTGGTDENDASTERRHAEKNARTAARSVLILAKLLNEDERADTEGLCIVLHRIANSVGKTTRTNKNTPSAAETIKAVATLLGDTETHSLAEKIVEAVQNRMEAQTERMEAAADQVEQAANANQAATTRAEKAWAELKEGLEDTGKAMKDSVEDLAGLMQGTHGGETGREPEGGIEQAQTAERGKQGGRTYADAMRATPTEHADAIARTELTRRQVVIRRDPDTTTDPLQGLTEKEIVAKANLAVQRIQSEGGNAVGKAEFLHARKTAGGGVVLVVKTEEAARWLRDREVTSKLASAMGGTTKAEAATCLVVAEYVPTSFDPGLIGTMAQVESNSGLTGSAIREARYIKPLERRAPGQRSAHMIIGFADPEQANHAIRYGLVIEGKKVTARRHKVEPKRCMKCQKIGENHNAAECKSIHDVCARCAGMHRTKGCTAEDAGELKCANCMREGHGAGDRSCPIFKAKLVSMHAKIPGYAYRFFPTSDPSTWEKNEGTATEQTQDGDSRRGDRQQSRVRDQGWGNRGGATMQRAETGHGDREDRGTGRGTQGQQHRRQMTMDDYMGGPLRPRSAGSQGAPLPMEYPNRGGGEGGEGGRDRRWGEAEATHGRGEGNAREGRDNAQYAPHPRRYD